MSALKEFVQPTLDDLRAIFDSL
jgi:hypothetical protein